MASPGQIQQSSGLKVVSCNTISQELIPEKSHVKPHVMRMSSNKRLGNNTEVHGISIRWLMLPVLTTLLDP